MKTPGTKGSSAHPKPPRMTDGAQGQPMHPKKGKPNKPNNKGGNGGGGLRYGAYGGYKGASRKKAKRLVGADIRHLKRDTHNEVRQERRTYQRERGDINHIAQKVNDNVRSLRLRTTNSYNDAINQSQAAQQALSAQIAANSGAVQGGANSELARLGLGGTNATDQMRADAVNSQNVASQNGLNNISNLSMAKSNARSLGNLMLSSIKGERQSQLGQARNLRDENISQLRDALHEARLNRGDSVRSLLDQMAQSGWSQYMDQASLNLQNRALRKTGSSYGYGVSSRFTPYSSSSYSPTYGSGYSSPSGSSGSSSGSGGGTANAAKLSLYNSLLNLNP